MRPMTFSGALASVSAALTMAPAAAQIMPAATVQPAGADSQAVPSSVNSVDVGDIIVTAQRRDESLSKTPVSVAVLSSDTLAKAQIVSEQDLRSATPGLSVRAGSSSNQLNYALRGQTQDAFSGTRPGVLPYLNEVQIGGAGGSSAFYDLQSIQVLKGPQGTLFGRSATGGAVLFTTAKPTEEFGGYFSASAGNYNAFNAEGAVNAPLSGDDLMARIAGVYQRRDGFQYNTVTDSHVGRVERFGLRGSLTANIGSVHNELVVDYFHSNSQNTVAVISGLLPFTGTTTNGVANPPYVPAQFLYAGIGSESNPFGPGATNIGQCSIQGSAPGCSPGAATVAFYNNYFANPNHPAGGLTGFLQTQNARGPYVVSSDGSNLYTANNTIVSNATTVEISGKTKLKNIFGYTDLHTSTDNDVDGSPFGLSQQVGRGFVTSTQQISDELQLLGSTVNDRLSYVVGTYFSSEKSYTIIQSIFFDILFGGQSQYESVNIRNKTYAGYAEGTYQLNDSGLAFTLGARYTDEKVGKQVLPDDTVYFLCSSAPTVYSCSQSATYKRLSWHVGLQDQISQNLLIYVTSRRAYKSGGFNLSSAPLVGTGAVGGDGYSAERVTDAEAGLKYQGTLGRVPVRLNIAAFKNWLTDAQRTAYVFDVQPKSVTVSVPQGSIYGAEMDLQVRPVRGLTIGGSFNYTHSSFSGVGPGAAPIPGCDGSSIKAFGSTQCYDQATDTPNVSGTVFADVSHDLTSRLELTFHGDVYGQSKNFTSSQSFNNAGTVIPSYSLVNLRVGLQDVTAGWSITANAKNVLNKTYYAGGVPAGLIYQVNSLVPGEPRTFTIQARYNF